MESSFNLVPSEAHPETMEFLSREWCNFAVQALQPELYDKSIVLLDQSVKKFESSRSVNDPFPMSLKMECLDDSDYKSMPQWKSNDVKSWIWMQQAMHPELNYNNCFRKKWFRWKISPFKIDSIKKWMKEFKQKRKEEGRLQKAEVHAALSVAGLAAALAALAAENTTKNDSSTPNTNTKEAAVASAAALVAAQCAQVAEAMGAKREQLSTVISSAMSGTNAGDIVTLTAAATTSLKGAATLKSRNMCKNRLNGGSPVLPIEDSGEFPVEFEKNKSLLAKGAELGVETPDGEYRLKSVSIVLNREAKVILKLRKLSLLKSKKECIVLDLHAELYKDKDCSEDSENTCYLIVLRTNFGTIKLDMEDDYHRYKTWATTINHMLILSNSFTNYELEFYKN